MADAAKLVIEIEDAPGARAPRGGGGGPRDIFDSDSPGEAAKLLERVGRADRAAGDSGARGYKRAGRSHEELSKLALAAGGQPAGVSDAEWGSEGRTPAAGSSRPR